jgi:putative transposase
LANQKEINIAAVCRQLGYSKQAYYKSIRNKRLKSCFAAIAKQKVLAIRHLLPRLGVRKLYHLLYKDFIKENIPVGRDKLFLLLRQENLLVGKKKKYVKTTDSRHWMRQYPNLIKNKRPTRPEQLWVADITWVNTKQGNSYLHLITDAYSKKIVGYELCSDMMASSTVKALKMAIGQRKYNRPIIHHSDRGLQYCSTLYVQLLKDSGMKISMTQDGSPYDNAVAERINGILKDEFGLDDVFESFEQLKLQTTQAITFYNQYRPHMSCNLLTPEKMHNQSSLTVKAWHKKTPGTFEGSWSFLP